MKQLTELTLDDLLDTPVWKRSMRAKFVNPIEGLVSPFMRSRFQLADGSTAIGHCQPSPGEPPAYPPAYLRPCILTPSGRVPLWLGGRVWKDARGKKRGAEPSQDELAEYYDVPGRRPEQIFPVTFLSDVEPPAGFIGEGTVPASGSMRGTEFAWAD